MTKQPGQSSATGGLHGAAVSKSEIIVKGMNMLAILLCAEIILSAGFILREIL
ncbi:hypothetical protein [Sphingomonas sp. 66-10]|jgi:hypothetical protein|uniref:hypothetical protein n=1 Tax=Sphingomonas sp. 66-10 TaxID=1895848 RepID=UPI00257CEE23|nr:hypothetical protein [Sphingomonas sp. 66-10]